MKTRNKYQQTHTVHFKLKLKRQENESLQWSSGIIKKGGKWLCSTIVYTVINSWFENIYSSTMQHGRCICCFSALKLFVVGFVYSFFFVSYHSHLSLDVVSVYCVCKRDEITNRIYLK